MVNAAAASLRSPAGRTLALTHSRRSSAAGSDSVGNHSLLQLGSRGSEVSDLQRRLSSAGFKVSVNGNFDSRTDAAVRAYQKAKGLLVDGQVGQQTWGSFLGKSYPPGVSMLKNGGTTTGFSGISSFSPGGSSGPTGTGVNFSGNANADMLRLAQAGQSAAMSMGGYTSHGLCATGVSQAIQNAFGFHVGGNGNTIGQNLPAGKFRQVNMSLEQALKTPGLILTWQRTPTAAGSLYGHTAITTGDGHTSCSDFIERDTLAGSAGRSGLQIYMPV